MAHPQPSTVAPDTAGTGLTTVLDLDDLFEVLGSRWRRCAVRYLDDRPDDTTTEAFVDDLYAMYGTTADDREQTRTAFHHGHLPKLAALDIVEYDREAGTVAPGRTLDEAAACLTAVESARA
ncbi:hypothetical protein ACFPYI_00520 [Halomarina salina]|uniref:DUF7344 domain-containing protein n=1 Tax=Halomarina salina TaxID=1872699 RepID=A0ABD5RHI6_9EURY|nr:hypothetical protein [Halomarina salina]